jgi:LuxR family maltose regulon positive regulatory protein
MVRAWIAVAYYYGVEAVPQLLDELELLLGDEPEHDQVRGELEATRGYVLWLMGDGAESLRHLEVALERVPEEHVDLRSNAELAFAQSSQMVGRKKRGIRFLDDLLAHPQRLHEMRATRLLAARVFIHLTAGDLLEADVANRRLWTTVERGGSAYVHAWTSYMQGLIHLQRCEWEAAVEHLAHSVKQRFIHHARAAVDSMTGLMLGYQALGREGEAQETLQILGGYVSPLGDPAMESLVMSAEARLDILRGRPGSARRWLEATEPPPEGALLWWLDIPSITRCRAMLAVGSPVRIEFAEARLEECAESIEAQHNVCQLIRVLTLQAMAHEGQDQTDQALAVLERAVRLARKGDLVLPFVELGTPVLALLDQLSGEREFTARVERSTTAFGASPGETTAGEAEPGSVQARRRQVRSTVAGGNECLTNRELDVLELLALRLRNKEIAARLGISSQTVNSHLKQVYQKLGAHGRREAVERAVAAGVLDRTPPS